MSTLHTFHPTKFHVSIGSWQPVLRIAPGDTVVTTTIDSAGVDQHGHKVNIGGNPQTGPFFITSANPGDVIAVRFDRVVPNRPYGHTSGRLAAHVVDPEFVFKLPPNEGAPFGMSTLRPGRPPSHRTTQWSPISRHSRFRLIPWSDALGLRRIAGRQFPVQPPGRTAETWITGGFGKA